MVLMALRYGNWKAILVESCWFFQHIAFKAGDKSSIRFWSDSWWGSSNWDPLLDSTSFSNWDLYMCRALNDGEVDAMTTLLERFDKVQVREPGDSDS